MSKKAENGFDRRGFLKKVRETAFWGATLSASLTLTTLAFDRFYVKPRIETMLGKEFNFIKKTDDTKGLVKLLDEGSEELTKSDKDYGDKIFISGPSTNFLYFMENHALKKSGSIVIGGGQCNLLDQNFFLTSYHIVEKFLDGSLPVGIFYDPKSGVMGRPEILATSPMWGLAIGKVNFGSNVKVIIEGLSAPVTKAEVTPGTEVFAYGLDPAVMFEDDVIWPIFNNIKFNDDGTFTQKNVLQMKLDLVETILGEKNKEISIPHTIDVPKGCEVNPILDTGSFYLREQLKEGYSGSVIYGFEPPKPKSLVGNVKEIPIQRTQVVGVVMGKYDCEQHPITCCISPKPIRRILENYINRCEEKKI